MTLPSAWTCPARSSRGGASVSGRNASPAWKTAPARDAPARFPPLVETEAKAAACAPPRAQGKPFSRWSSADLAQELIARGVVPSISSATVWRWLHADALRPWRFRSWISPRDPAFAEKAGRVLDLYQGYWQGKPLGPDEYVLSTDEKTSIQARQRKHPTAPCAPGESMRVEHEYRRQGALAYLAAWDVHRAQLFGRCETRTGIASFERLVAEVMDQEPYHSAPRVFWVMDNGSSHRGARCVQRLQKRWPALLPVHLPVHASWLNQIEIYFSILQRKVLTPNDFRSLPQLMEAILSFQQHYTHRAQPFAWKFTRDDLTRLLARLSDFPAPLAKAA